MILSFEKVSMAPIARFLCNECTFIFSGKAIADIDTASIVKMVNSELRIVHA